MHILLLGSTGQLGWELQRALLPLGKVTALDYPEIDLSQPHELFSLLQNLQPSIQVIINAAAYTSVDQAESEVDLAMAINGAAPGVLAELAQTLRAAFIHFSTDYVFDGRKGSAYIEEDAPNPLNSYGRSKLAGEQASLQAAEAALVLRTSWVYSLRRDSFVTKVLQWAGQQTSLPIVSDQVSNPTWARALAETTSLLISRAGSQPFEWLRDRRGIYHLAGDGWASRMEWAQAILEYATILPEKSGQPTYNIRGNQPLFTPFSDVSVIPASTSDFPTPAQRPLYSALNCSRFKDTFNLSLPDWRTCLRLAMADKYPSDVIRNAGFRR